MKYLVVLGRVAEMSLAELEALYGGVRRLGEGLAIVKAEREVDIARLGGAMKVGRVLEEDPVKYLKELPEGKITLGVSDYRAGRKDSRLGLGLKKKVGRSLRVVPSENGVVSGAAAHHNRLGERQNHVELAYFDGGVASMRSQDITAYAKRDQARPARDAKVGMLPPKLAQVLINLCGDLPEGSRVLDPFCGTGVVLQEAILMGYRAIGTDVSERMIEYSAKNLDWLSDRNPGLFERIGLSGDKAQPTTELYVGNATSVKWSYPKTIDAVASEIYLGSPLSAPPSEIRLRQLKFETKEILRGFLRNLAGQVRSGTPVALAVPSWRRLDGPYSGLNILDEAEEMGYNVVSFKNLDDLLYYREGQVVAREIIVLRKS